MINCSFRTIINFISLRRVSLYFLSQVGKNAEAGKTFGNRICSHSGTRYLFQSFPYRFLADQKKHLGFVKNGEVKKLKEFGGIPGDHRYRKQDIVKITC